MTTTQSPRDRRRVALITAALAVLLVSAGIGAGALALYLFGPILTVLGCLVAVAVFAVARAAKTR